MINVHVYVVTALANKRFNRINCLLNLSYIILMLANLILIQYIFKKSLTAMSQLIKFI